MSTPAQLTNPADPTQDLQNQADASRLAIINALQQNQDNPQPTTQPQPQQQQAQQPQPDPSQQQAPGGPVKQGLRGILLRIMGNVAAGGVLAAAYPGNIMGEARQKTQAGIDESKARTAEYNAQTADLQSQAALRNAQAKPRLLVDPETGGPAFGPDGNVRTGTLEDQKELNETFRVTGGRVSVPDALAASIGMPELAGHSIPATTFNTLMTNQNSKTIESEIARLSQYEISKGNDPNQSPDVQALIQIRKHMQNFTPELADEQYRELYAKAHSGGKLTPGEGAWMKGYEHQKVLVPQARLQLQMNGGGLIPGGGGQQPGSEFAQFCAVEARSVRK